MIIIIIITSTGTAIEFPTWEPRKLHALGDDLALLVDEVVFRPHAVLDALNAILQHNLVLDGSDGQHRVATFNVNGTTAIISIIIISISIISISIILMIIVATLNGR